MPLFMDYHFTPGVTLEEDLKTQYKDLNVPGSYKINEEDGMIYRYVNGPEDNFNMESLSRDLLMNKVLTQKERKKNITEIALDAGISNPSYFAKCFHEKYGILPSQIAV